MGFKKGDKIIWDSGFGYDLGSYVSKGNPYCSITIINHTGLCPEQEQAVWESQVLEDTWENREKMLEKYKYALWKNESRNIKDS